MAAKIIIEIQDGRVVNISPDTTVMVKIFDRDSINHALEFKEVLGDPDFERVNQVADARARKKFYKEEGP